MDDDEASYNSDTISINEEAIADAYEVSLEVADDIEEDDIFNEEMIGSWSPVNQYDVKVDIDGVDNCLLAKVKEEVPVVLNKIQHDIYDGENISLLYATKSDLLGVWLNRHLLDCFVKFVNNNITPKVKSHEIKAFIQVELMLAFYRCSPGRYYDKKLSKCYLAFSNLSYDRYMAILKALCTSANGRFISEDTWVPVFNHDKEVSDAMEILRKNCANIGYVEGKSYVALDDDLLRLRSKQVNLAGFNQINNPNKGMGVVHHAAVSVATGLYLSGHIAYKGETTLDAVKVIQRSLCGSSSESQINMRNNSILYDRGYGGIEGQVNQWSIRVQAQLLGTSKRMLTFPFTFDQVPGNNRTLIQERGTSCQYWAKKKVTGTNVEQYAMANRNGLGRVVLMQTTMPEFGPGTFCFVSRSKKDVEYVEQNEHLKLFETNIVQLTAGQRSPEWFLMRKFRITGTGAVILWRRSALLYRNGTINSFSLSTRRTLTMLSIKYRNDDVPTEQQTEESDPDRLYTRAELATMTKNQLVAICITKSISRTGNKGVLVDRILEYDMNEATPIPISTVLLKSWFMSPQQQNDFTITGSLNESKILDNLPKFLKNNSPFEIQAIKEYGLLCASNNRFYAAFSPDGIAVATSNDFGQVTALLELKSKLTAGTELKEREIQAKYGSFTHVNLTDEDGPTLFKATVPEANFRCQLLHGMSCGSLRNTFYVVASSTAIIRVVYIQASEYDLQQYQTALDEQYEEGDLAWIIDGNLPRNLDLQAVPYAVDLVSIKRTLELWRSINRIIIDRGRPLPHGKMILPSIIAMWNRCKGPIDLYSRFLKNVHSQHFKLSPLGAVWLRIVMTCVYNAYQAHTLIYSNIFLQNSECKSYTDYQQYKKRNNSFSHFCYELAKDLHLQLKEEKKINKNKNEVASIENNGNNKIPAEKKSYNKRYYYFEDRNLISIRLNPHLDHDIVRIIKETGVNAQVDRGANEENNEDHNDNEDSDDEEESDDDETETEGSDDDDDLDSDDDEENNEDKNGDKNGNGRMGQPKCPKRYDGKAQKARQERCVWCCCFKHHLKQAKPKHCREGFKTTTKCGTCNVPLCTKKRYGEASCFEMWHTSHVAIDACSAEVAATMHVQKNCNRKPPPNRKRQRPETDEDGNINNNDGNTNNENNNNSQKAKRKKMQPVFYTAKRLRRGSI